MNTYTFTFKTSIYYYSMSVRVTTAWWHGRKITHAPRAGPSCAGGQPGLRARPAVRPAHAHAHTGPPRAMSGGAWLGRAPGPRGAPKASGFGAEAADASEAKATRDHEDEDDQERAALRRGRPPAAAASSPHGGASAEGRGALERAWEEAEAKAAVREGQRARKRACTAAVPPPETRCDQKARSPWSRGVQLRYAAPGGPPGDSNYLVYRSWVHTIFIYDCAQNPWVCSAGLTG